MTGRNLAQNSNSRADKIRSYSGNDISNSRLRHIYGIKRDWIKMVFQSEVSLLRLNNEAAYITIDCGRLITIIFKFLEKCS